MPTRITVPLPTPEEESRQLAESVSDMHFVIGTIVDGAAELVPGESIEELRASWRTGEESFRMLVSALTDKATQPAVLQTLVDTQLAGDVGRLKRSTLARLRDLFFSFWNSEPRTDEKRRGAGDAASDYLELGATVVGSIPGWEQIEELISLVRQLVQARRKRGV
jgi:hypothetical protein